MRSNIRQLRIEKQVSQAELGEAIGLSQQIVSRMERDRSKIQVDSLIAMADYFQVSTDCVLGYRPKTTTDLCENRFAPALDVDPSREVQELAQIVDDDNRKEVLGLLLDLVYHMVK